MRGICKKQFLRDLYFRSDSCFESVLHKEILYKLCGEEKKLAFEQEVIKAYNSRLEDFKDNHVGIH